MLSIFLDLTNPSGVEASTSDVSVVGEVDVIVLFLAFVTDVCSTEEDITFMDSASGAVVGETISSVITVSPRRPPFNSLEVSVE
jgi:hypothetical protein